MVSNRFSSYTLTNVTWDPYHGTKPFVNLFALIFRLNYDFKGMVLSNLELKVLFWLFDLLKKNLSSCIVLHSF